MWNFKQNIISNTAIAKDILPILDNLGSDATLFIIDENHSLIGSLTDGDIRRGLICGVDLEHDVAKFMNNHPRHLVNSNYSLGDLIDYRNDSITMIPIVDDNHSIINIINFRLKLSFLPIDVIIMAGGRGERLRPLTDSTPKPLLEINGKPIISYNIDRLNKFGISSFNISIRYLGEMLKEYFNNNNNYSDLFFSFLEESSPLGTIGAATLIKKFDNDIVLIMNSDILTDLNFELFYKDFVDKGADFSIVSIPYSIEIPYAILEDLEGEVIALKEKPTYTYLSNAGIYLVKVDLLKLIPKEMHFDATEFIELLISLKKKVISYSFSGYWLDIGRHEDYKKAKSDVFNLVL